ncbi:MAG TPA: hypothetical protein VG405_02410 [Solirubrobacteraceae bacterium]|nr:hypothetical protein [Solirubrobacteraceae bacterium]
MIGRTGLMALLALLAGSLAGCAGQAGGTGRTTTAPAAGARNRVKVPAGLAVSRVSSQTVQPQPASGSCHAIGHGLLTRPDPRCTPGALNPNVRQSDIRQTICVTGWTATVRPPEPITESEKQASMAAYRDTSSLSGYEYDHLVPLELGGATNDPRNLWPEPGASPNPKDTVELELRDRVCDGRMTLAQAQREIASNWIKLAHPGGL